MVSIKNKFNAIVDIVLLIVNSKIINIVSCSSYSTQLGFLTAYLYQNKSRKISKIIQKNEIYVFLLFPTRSDRSIRNVCNFKKVLGEQKFFIFKIDNFVLRLLVYLSLKFVYLIKNKNNIFLWQTRYRWINDLFGSSRYKIYLPVPRFKVILFGDGFLNLMPVDKPPWLIKTKKIKKVKLIDSQDLYKSYHHFKITNKKYNFKSELINKKFIKDFLFRYIYNDYDNQLTKVLSKIKTLVKDFPNKKKGIYIFPTTTFFETNRCNLENEINMYVDFLRKSEAFKFSCLLIKPHPGSSKIKNRNFLKKLKEEDDFQQTLILEPYLFDKDISLANIPLEIIITFMIDYFEVENILLACCSTASLSVKTLFPKLKMDYAFGSFLLEKYVNVNYINQRLEQEKMIKNAAENS